MSSSSSSERGVQLEAFQRQHRTSVVTLVFTDMVNSTAWKQQLGDRKSATFFQEHHRLLRRVLARFPAGAEVETAGDSFLLIFTTPSDAIQFALQVQAGLRMLASTGGVELSDRIGLHLGEVVMGVNERQDGARDLYGIQIDTCARVMSLAGAEQILMTRAVFDSARQVLKGEDIEGVGALEWLNHGAYLLKGLEEPVEICEVRELGRETAPPPPSSDKAQRQVRAGEEPVLGWRPAVGQVIPNTRWVLECKLGEGGFGEVWLGRNPATKELRVFKFCFQAERIRFLKRELTLFRVLKERVGAHPNIVRLHDVYLEQPPFYVEMDYVEGRDLRTWCEARGGIGHVPLETRLEIVAQAAEGLQAAHDAGIIHRDIKPANVLIADGGGRSAEVALQSRLVAKLTDFGIGQVVSEEFLSGITQAGFTQTMMASSSSSHTGTRLYMAPELLAGKPASIRSDIYSLGVLLYQVVVGDFTRPATTDWAAEISDPLLREDLRHCFAGNPSDRFNGAGQLAKHLRALPDRQAALARQQAEQQARERAAYRRGVFRTAGAAAVILGLMASLVWYAHQQARRADQLARREAEGARVLRHNIYISDMNVAGEALAENNLWLAAALVRKHFPKPAEEDFRGFEWRYLWKLCQGDELHTFSEHPGLATCAVFSPDGRTLVTADLNRTVHVLDLATRRVVASLSGFTNRLVRNSIAFSPDGKALAVADGSTIQIWSVREWDRPMQRIRWEGASDGRSLSAPLVFAPDGQTLAALNVNQIGFWNTSAWQPKQVLRGKLKQFGGALAYSSDGKLLAVAGAQAIEIWDMVAESQTAGSPIPFSYAAHIRFAQGDTVLAAGAYDGDVILWDVPAGQTIKRWKPNKTLAFGLDVSPDGRMLATGGADQMIHLWDIATQEKLATLQGHLNEIWSIAFSPDGQLLASASKDGSVKLWSTTAKPATPTLTNSLDPLWFSPDGRQLITSDLTRDLQLWDVPSGRLLREIKIPTAKPQNWVFPDAISPDGHRLALRTASGTIELWDIETVQCLATNRVASSNAFEPVFSHDGQFVAAADRRDSLAYVWDATTGREFVRIPGLQRALAFSPDGTLLAGASLDYAIQVWDLRSERQLATFRGHQWIVFQLAFSPDSKRLASGAIDNTGRVWDLATQREVAVMQGHQSGLHCLAFSPDGRTIATGSTDETIRLWSAATGQQLLSIRSYKQDPGRILFSADGNALAVGMYLSGTRTPVFVQRAPTLKEIDRLERERSRANGPE